MPMKITYLGQAGYFFEAENCKILIDPYLSNSVVKVNPKNYRRYEVEDWVFSLKPDVILFTHDHLDHYDPETAPRFITTESNLTVLAPRSVFDKVRLLGGNNNYVVFEPHTVWTEKGITFTSVTAKHSDPYAIGVIIYDGERKYYHTGDTLYCQDIFKELPEDIYALFLPVNGVGNNMNMMDAARFAQKVGAEKVVPMHTGLFDSIDPHTFPIENKVIGVPFKTLQL